MHSACLIFADVLTIASPAAAQSPPNVTPNKDPMPLPTAELAVANGVEKLCAWFVRGEGYSLPAAFQTAMEAGFKRGVSVQMVPLPEMREAGSYSTIGFQASIANAPPEGSGVAAFFTYHTPVCQIQVYGYKEDATRYIAGLKDSAWTLVDTQRSENVHSERWLTKTGTQSMTLVVNRWAGAQPAPGGLGFILNVLPGDDRKRGQLK